MHSDDLRTVGGKIVYLKPAIGIAPSRTFQGSWWDIANLCRRLRMAGVELKYELPFILPERWSLKMVKHIASLAREEGWFLSLHGPYTNIGALLFKRWQSAVDEHLEALEVAHSLGAKTYIVHPGWVERKYCTIDLFQRCRDKTKEALEKIFSHSETVKICVENQNPDEGEKIKVGISPDDLRYLVHDLPGVMFAFDLGHAHLFNRHPHDFVMLLEPKRVELAHIHDNEGVKDSHLPPGQGDVDWEKFLLRYQSEGWSFPLFLEIVGGEAEFRAGFNYISTIWGKCCAKNIANCG